MFSPILIKNKIVAYEKKVNSFHIVYGTRYMKRNDLIELFPHYQFCFIKQEHGNTVIRAKFDQVIQADAHWTDQANEALVIQTADCMPLFLMRDFIVCAVHAGWRGVYKKIALQALTTQPLLKNPELLISIGPHILKESFNVDEDVALKLASSSPNASKMVERADTGKYAVSLMGLVKDQIESINLTKTQYLFAQNTFLLDLFYSFRRDAEKRIGQYSFVVRTLI